MWDLIVSVPDHCLSFCFTFIPELLVPDMVICGLNALSGDCSATEGSFCWAHTVCNLHFSCFCYVFFFTWHMLACSRVLMRVPSTCHRYLLWTFGHFWPMFSRSTGWKLPRPLSSSFRLKTTFIILCFVFPILKQSSDPLVTTQMTLSSHLSVALHHLSFGLCSSRILTSSDSLHSSDIRNMDVGLPSRPTLSFRSELICGLAPVCRSANESSSCLAIDFSLVCVDGDILCFTVVQLNTGVLALRSCDIVSFKLAIFQANFSVIVHREKFWNDL